MLQRADDRHPARTARRPRLAVLGNGGIAMEIAYETMDLCDVYWVVRDTHIGSAFFDAAVADILYRAMRRRERQLLSRPARLRTSTAEDGADDDNGVPQSGAEGMCGPALGPDWVHFGLRDRKSLPPARGASRLGRAVMGETEALTTAREAGSAECVSEDDDDDDDETSAPDGDRHLLHVECNAEVLVVQPVRETESTTAEPPPPAGVSADTPLPPPPPGDACSERLRLHSSNGHALDVDLVLCAIGVCPAVHPHMFHAAGAPGPLRFAPLPSESRALTRQEAGDRGGGAPDEPCGLVVDRHMRAAVPSVYAAGDCCTVDLSATAEWGQDALAHTPPDNAENGMRDGSPADPPLWFQMRLWSQAQTMGACAARSILHDLFGTPNGHHEETTPDGRTDLPAAPLDLELFVHATEFGGLKVILLGRYQAQGIADDGFCFLESAHCDDAQDVHHWVNRARRTGREKRRPSAGALILPSRFLPPPPPPSPTDGGPPVAALPPLAPAATAAPVVRRRLPAVRATAAARLAPCPAPPAIEHRNDASPAHPIAAPAPCERRLVLLPGNAYLTVS
eukprot:ctg_2228.g438